jgi:hypothetical protein
VVEDESGDLIGYCSIHRRPRPSPRRPWIAERYIVAFGRDLRYRGCLLRDGTTRVGEILVRAGLDMVAAETGRRPMPSVSALVRAENLDSHRVLSAFGFQCRPATETGYAQDLLWRPRVLALGPAPGADVYVPPISPLAEPRRNDPCPCGSGLKYKRCCKARVGMHEAA